MVVPGGWSACLFRLPASLGRGLALREEDADKGQRQQELDRGADQDAIADMPQASS